MGARRSGAGRAAVIVMMRGRGLRGHRIGFVSVDFIAGHLVQVSVTGA
jgi:hypothetical protein